MRDKQVFLKFCEHLRSLLKAGLPLRDALDILSKSAAACAGSQTAAARAGYAQPVDAGRAGKSEKLAERVLFCKKKQRSGKSEKLAERVLSFMKKGYSFSSAVSVNGVVHVDDRLCALVAAADKAGNLCEMLGFITDSESEKSGFTSKLVGTCVYPLGVVLLAGLGAFFLVKNCSLFGFKTLPDSVFPGFTLSVLFILIFALGFFFVACKTNTENPQLSFFSPLSFFLSCGFDLKSALALVSIGSGLKNASLCSCISHNLSCGVPFSRSLKEQNFFSGEAVALIALAEKSGRLAETCRTVAARLVESEKQKKQRFIRFGEPALISAVGVYVLVLAQSVILPFITSFEYML